VKYETEQLFCSRTIGAEPTGATGHLPRYSESTGAKISFCPGTFWSIISNEQSHLECHIIRLKLYRELSVTVTRCVNGIRN